MELKSKGPVVFLLAYNPDLLESCVKSLNARGALVYQFLNREKLLEFLKELSPDLIVAEFRVGDPSSTTLLSEVRKTHLYTPGVVFIAEESVDFSSSEAKELGALDLVKMKADARSAPEDLWNLMAGFYAKILEDRARYLRVPSNLPAYLGADTGFTVTNIGYGGLFIEGPEGPLLPIGIEREIQVSFDLGDGGSWVRAKGEIVWKRPLIDGGAGKVAGAGLRFSFLSPDDQDRVLEFIRAQRAQDFVELRVSR